jgi:hypothetical protein
MSKEENSFGFWEILIIVLIIIIFIVSFGQMDIALEKESTNKEEKEKDNLTKLQARHKKLKELIKKKEELYLKLNKKFKRIYFGVRFVLASLYVGYNASLYFVFKITNLADLLNWNQFALIVIALFSFIAFGTLANVQDFINNIKMRLESRTYDKYVDITEQLEVHKNEELVLTATITKKKAKIELIKQQVVEDAVLIESKDKIV